MVGVFAETYRIGNIVKKVYRKFSDDDNATEESIKAIHNEASIYMLLGNHPRIAKYPFIDPSKTYIELKYYPNGNLKGFLEKHRPHIEDTRRKYSARQIIESAEYIHTMGVRHSDFRLEQWLLDEMLNARLSDFNASGYDSNAELGLRESEAIGAENASHFLQRECTHDSTVESDLFALGSTLFELVTGKAPYDDQPRESIEAFFREGIFPSVEGLLLDRLSRVAGQ
jgi:serine/threonine protein kinase